MHKTLVFSVSTTRSYTSPVSMFFAISLLTSKAAEDKDAYSMIFVGSFISMAAVSVPRMM